MALIVCPECGKNISDKASACPHCGLPAGFFVKKTTTADTKDGRSTSNTGLPNTPKDVSLQNLGNILVFFKHSRDYIFFIGIFIHLYNVVSKLIYAMNTAAENVENYIVSVKFVLVYHIISVLTKGKPLNLKVKRLLNP